MSDNAATPDAQSGDHKERWLSWSKALDSKSNVVVISPWVRIPLFP